MAAVDFVHSFEARIQLYKLDERVRSILSQTWPVIEPVVEAAVDEIVSVIPMLPLLKDVIARHADEFRKLELAHFRALLGGNLDRVYAESCRQTVLQEAALGFDGRVRSTAGSY